jgi:hypothetical protein
MPLRYCKILRKDWSAEANGVVELEKVWALKIRID